MCYPCFQQVLTNRQGSMFLFSLLSFSQRTEGSLAYKFARGIGRWAPTGIVRQQASFEVASCEKKYSSKKLSCETLSKFILNVGLFSSNGSDSCMENLHAKEPCRNWLCPYSVSSPLNSSSGCTRSSKVSCRQRHPRQAAKDPFLKALAARVHTPASLSKNL